MAQAALKDEREREFKFTQQDFKALAAIVHKSSGIKLGDHKQELVYSRLSRRLRALGIGTFEAYRAHLDGREGEAELLNLINAITTNLTAFFRESHHFDHLRDQVLRPALQNAGRSGTKSIRIWSAGCSTGEEPYTIAMTVLDTISNAAAWDAKILATDLDTKVLAHGKAGRYAADSLEQVPSGLRSRFFSKASDGKVEVLPALKNLVHFKHLNLQASWPMNRQYDAIFCRNVMIYFDGPTKAQLMKRFTQRLKPGGFLYIGHSESVQKIDSTLRLVGRTTFERVA